MKALKILLTPIITLSLIFAVSFLLDLPLIRQNWLRYITVIALAVMILFIGILVIKQQIDELKKN